MVFTFEPLHALLDQPEEKNIRQKTRESIHTCEETHVYVACNVSNCVEASRRALAHWFRSIPFWDSQGAA